MTPGYFLMAWEPMAGWSGTGLAQLVLGAAG
jgi:hypothetical protein